MEAGDRIEHGAVIPIELVGALRDLGLIVVTQPAFVARRGDRYLREHPAEEQSDLWRCGSLLRAASASPPVATHRSVIPIPGWRSKRPTHGAPTMVGFSATPSESRLKALAMWLTPASAPGGPRRRVAAGQPARLCVLRSPSASHCDRRRELRCARPSAAPSGSRARDPIAEVARRTALADSVSGPHQRRMYSSSCRARGATCPSRCTAGQRGAISWGVCVDRSRSRTQRLRSDWLTSAPSSRTTAAATASRPTRRRGGRRPPRRPAGCWRASPRSHRSDRFSLRGR